MKRKTFAYLFSLMLMCGLSGCNRIESEPSEAGLQAGVAADRSIPEGALIADVTGEALMKDRSLPDDRIRIAAMLDAIRRFARNEQYRETKLIKGDTLTANRNIDGLEVVGVTIKQGGMVLLDSVVVTVVDVKGNRSSIRRWKSFNMELVEPGPESDARIEQFLGDLKLRGIEAGEGKPSGRGLWQESLAIRRWRQN